MDELKLKMSTPDLTDKNIEQITNLFPNVITEIRDENGETKKAIDFDLLKQMLSKDLVECSDERYRLGWPGKKASLLKANTPIKKTLGPCRDDSVNFDTTENLYIEGDNFEVLKILQESYLGKIKMIYIDPPYNTGNDFIYKDNFAKSKEEYDEELGTTDEEGGKLFRNTESNGRYHSDWLSMMYERLIVARDLLKGDGVIFISIDDNEVHNLRKICDEVFGEENFVAQLPTIMNLKGNQDEFGFAGTHEYTLVFSKEKNEKLKLGEFSITEEDADDWEIDDIGYWKKGATLKRTGNDAPREKRPNGFFPIYISSNDEIDIKRRALSDIELFPIIDGKEMSWRWSSDKVLRDKRGIIVIRNGDSVSLYKKQRPDLGDLPSKKPKSLFYKAEYSSGNGTSQLKDLLEIKAFNNPKPINLIADFISIGLDNEEIILDFFSGSAAKCR